MGKIYIFNAQQILNQVDEYLYLFYIKCIIYQQNNINIIFTVQPLETMLLKNTAHPPLRLISRGVVVCFIVVGYIDNHTCLISCLQLVPIKL
jgi:hypothetical protein